MFDIGENSLIDFSCTGDTVVTRSDRVYLKTGTYRVSVCSKDPVYDWSPALYTLTVESTINLGDVNNDGSVTINDDLEILKYLAKLDNAIDGNEKAKKSALICDPNAPAPSINDALEILKYLAKLQSIVKG